MAQIPLILDAQATSDILHRLDVLETMRALFTALGHGRALQPPQTLTIFPEGRGDVIVYSGVLPDTGVFGVKVSPYLADPAGGRVTAWTLLMSLTTGHPVLLCDALELTLARTAATTALAVDILAPAEAGTLVVFGSGRQALAHLRYVLPLRAWRHVRMYSPHIMEKTATLRPALDALAPDISIATTHTDAIAGADVIMLCTSSGTSVVDPRELDHPAVVTSISTNVPQAHEIPPACLPELDVYCDYRGTTPAIAGEMRLAHDAGWSPDQIRGDLGELLTGSAPAPSRKRHAFFRSVGLGLEDVQLAYAVYHQYQAEQGA